MSPVWCDLVEPDIDRAEWLAWRREGIGASDLGAICGMSPWATPMSVYLDKVGLLDDNEPSEAMRWGSLLEEPIAREFEVREGLYVHDQQLCVHDGQHPHRRCTLDGLVADTPAPDDRAVMLGPLQIKCSRDRPWDEVPDAYALQVMWEMGITGMPHEWLAVLHGGNTLRVYEFEFDPIQFAALARIADTFWTAHVLAKNPPPADGSDATTEALKDAYRERATDEVVTFDGVETDLAREWQAAEHAVTAAEMWRDRCKNQLRSILGEAIVALDGQGDELVTWKPQRGASRFDTKGLRAAYPEIAAEFLIPAGTSRVLRATKTLKELAGANHEGANQ
jgi:putative phage-type endonuclease